MIRLGLQSGNCHPETVPVNSAWVHQNGQKQWVQTAPHAYSAHHTNTTHIKLAPCGLQTPISERPGTGTCWPLSINLSLFSWKPPWRPLCEWLWWRSAAALPQSWRQSVAPTLPSWWAPLHPCQCRSERQMSLHSTKINGINWLILDFIYMGSSSVLVLIGSHSLCKSFVVNQFLFFTPNEKIPCYTPKKQ